MHIARGGYRTGKFSDLVFVAKTTDAYQNYAFNARLVLCQDFKIPIIHKLLTYAIAMVTLFGFYDTEVDFTETP